MYGAVNKMTNKILVIDDEKGMRDMLVYAFEQEQYSVAAVAGGEEGVKLLSEQDVDIVVSDIKMPTMDGVEVLERIKRDWPHIEVILITGYGTMETAIESIRKGAFDYVLKPFNIDDLIKVVKKAVETKELKSQLISMKQVDKLKDDFFSLVTHELKSPLMSISGACELLAVSLPKTGDESQSEKLIEVIDKQTEKMKKLIDDLLDFTKLESGFWKLKKQDWPISKLVNDAVIELVPLARSRNIELVFSADQAVTVNCDHEQIKRVLTNLIINAIKYSRENGEVAVWYEKTGDEIQFVVRDNGIGLSAVNLGKVFDKFFRVDTSLQGEKGGLGLGLPMCKRLIEMHNGKIWASSEGLSKGSRFCFSIPIK
jgi:signal transduction histidine kinase